MTRQHAKKQTAWLVWIAPILAFPLMINVRIFPFVAPNEEPKWLILTLCALWMGLASAWLWFWQKTILLHKPGIPALLLTIYVVLLAIGIGQGPNITEGMIRFAFWLFCIMVFVWAAWACKHQQQTWLKALAWSVSIGSFVFSLRYWESYFIDYGKPQYNISVLFSPIGHINFTGDVLIILLPMLMWILAKYTNPTLRVINWFSITTIATILLVASSRGALGGLALATLISGLIFARHVRKQNLPRAQGMVWLLLGSALAASVVIYSTLPYHYRDLARVSATAGQAIEGKGKIQVSPGNTQPPLVDMWVALSPLLGARTAIFASTTAMILDAPWLGQGTGNFAWVYPYYSNRYPDFRDSLSSARTFTTNPHNVVLQIASQNGIPAMLIFMGLLLYFWYRLARAAWQRGDSLDLAGLAAITAAIFDAMFNHVFFNPASMFVFALLGGTWWGFLPEKTQEKPSITLPGRSLGIAAAAMAMALSIWPLRWVWSEWYVGQAMAHVRQPAKEADFYAQAYAWDKENFRAVFGMGQVAYRQKQYIKSATYFEAFQSFYPYNPPALNMLGAAYMSSGQFLKAKEAFERALEIYPGFDMVEQNLKRVNMILWQQRMRRNTQQPPG